MTYEILIKEKNEIIKDLEKKLDCAMKELEEIANDKYEANPWTVVELKCAKRARLAL